MDSSVMMYLFFFYVFLTNRVKKINNNNPNVHRHSKLVSHNVFMGICVPPLTSVEIEHLHSVQQKCEKSHIQWRCCSVVFHDQTQSS